MSPDGDVPKWLKGADSKSARRRKACGGSNPSISAICEHRIASVLFLPPAYCDKQRWGAFRFSRNLIRLPKRGGHQNKIAPRMKPMISEPVPIIAYSKGFLRYLTRITLRITGFSTTFSTTLSTFFTMFRTIGGSS